MKASDAIRTALTSTQNIIGWYLADLSDADLLARPAPNANHIAWQLGHLINSEQQLAAGYLPGAPYPELPAGFKEQHNKEMASQDPPVGFLTKEKYLDLFNRTREATKAGLSKLSETDLDKPTTGNMAQFAPTVGAILLLTANHDMMHAGQFTVVRRKLGKPVLF
jgi:uncharacterized damage-inducible protein DinB